MNVKKALVPLALLLLVFTAACGGGGAEQKAAPAAQKLTPEEEKLQALLPASDEVAGWSRGEEVRFFNPDNLYEIIDGAAENFLIYGFEQLVTTDYKNDGQSSDIVLEIYKMQDPRNAFGIYASERNPDSEYLQIGAEGYVGGTALNFWSDAYYVRMTVFEESEALQGEMKKMAEAVSRKIGGAGAAALPEIALFPTANQVPHSVRYLAQDVLGQIYLKSGFEARYKNGEKGSKIVIALPGDEAAAQEAMVKYQDFTAKNGGSVAREVTTPGDGGFVGKDSYYGNMAVIRSGERIFVSLGEASADKALAQAAACIKK